MHSPSHYATLIPHQNKTQPILNIHVSVSVIPDASYFQGISAEKFKIDEKLKNGGLMPMIVGDFMCFKDYFATTELENMIR